LTESIKSFDLSSVDVGAKFVGYAAVATHWINALERGFKLLALR
jgi:hypothetical protein